MADNPQRWLDQAAQAQAELDALNTRAEQVRTMRDADVVLAAEHGATHRSIGAALGISGPSVKKILDKHRPETVDA